MAVLIIHIDTSLVYRYPSKELYCTAVEQLIQKYPHLRDNVKKGSGMVSVKLFPSFPSHFST